MSQLPPQDRPLVELLTLEFPDTAYRRKSTPAGQARHSAFRAFALSVPQAAVRWAVCVEAPRKAFVLSSE